MSDTKVIQLKTERDLVVDDVIGTLSYLLDEANEGRIIALAAAYVRPDGSINTSRSASDNAGHLLGAATLLQHRLCQDCEEL